MTNSAYVLNSLILILIGDLTDDTKIHEAIRTFNELHSSTLKYGYSDITNRIIEAYENRGFNELIDIFNQIAENIKLIIDYIDDEKLDGPNNKETKERLYTLKEHINFLLVFLEYAASVDKSTFKKYTELIDKYKKLNNRNKNLNDQFLDLNNKYEKLTEKSEELKNDITKQKSQNITILGIFSAIVTTFVAGVGIADKSLSEIADTSPVKLGFLVALLSFVFMHLLNYLYNFIIRISGGAEHSIDRKINIVLVIIIFVLGILSYLDFQIVNELTYWYHNKLK